MRLMSLLAVALVGGTLHLDAPAVPVPVNCVAGSSEAQHTTLGALREGTRPGGPSQGHAHNDYENGDPLTDALAAGLTSVEADVWAVDGELQVAHTRAELDPARTLTSLYLEPLVRRLAGDPRRRPGPRLQLLIDIKSAPARTLPLVRAELAHHASILTSYHGCTASPGPVSVVVSGSEVQPSPPARGTVSYFGYDVQPEHLVPTGTAGAITPLISMQWDVYFAWDGRGGMPSSERARLERMVRAAHAVGSAVRFYDTPDDPATGQDGLWRELVAAGVDYIGTDDLAEFRSFDESPAGPT